MPKNPFLLTAFFAEVQGASIFSIKQFLPRVKRYFRENFGAPFVIGFHVLLMVAAGLLVVGNSALANEVAICAFYVLVAGVVLQLVSLIRSRGEESGQD